MATLPERHLRTFENYHNTFLIEMTDLHEESDLQFIGEYFKYGKRFDENQPGVTGQTLDQTYDGSSSIFHYFCNRTKAITGVCGGMMYKYNNVFLYIGFSNPLFWGRKRFFVELKQNNETAKWAYDQLDNIADRTSTCCGWKVRAVFDSMDNPELKVTIGRDGSF